MKRLSGGRGDLAQQMLEDGLESLDRLVAAVLAVTGASVAAAVPDASGKLSELLAAELGESVQEVVF